MEDMVVAHMTVVDKDMAADKDMVVAAAIVDMVDKVVAVDKKVDKVVDMVVMPEASVTVALVDCNSRLVEPFLHQD